MGTPRKNPDSIEAILCDIRNYGKNDTKYARKLLVKLTGKDNWTEQQCEQVYDAILQQYLDDEQYLNLMRDVSGRSKGYQCIENITDRRIKYLEEHNDERGHESLAKNEERHCIEYIARELQKAIDNGTILRLVEKWISKKTETSDEEFLESHPEQNKNRQKDGMKQNQDKVAPSTLDSKSQITNNHTQYGDMNLEDINGPVIIGNSGNVQVNPPEPKSKSENELLKKIINLLKFVSKHWRVIFRVVFIICIITLTGLHLFEFFNPDISQVKSISPTPQKVILRPGETYTIEPSVLPETAINTSLNYSSSDTNIATVHKTEGIVLAQDNWKGEDEQIVDITISANNNDKIKASKTIIVKRTRKEALVESVIQTKVRKVDLENNGWETIIEAKVGDELEYQIIYENKSNVPQNHVVIRDMLPACLEYIPGSTKLRGNAYPEGIVNEGIDIGSYAPGVSALISFRAKVSNTKLTPGTNTLVNKVSVDEKASMQEYAAITIKYEPEYTLEVSVRFAEVNGKNWANTLEARIDDELEYQIVYHNISNVSQNNVVIRNVLPTNLEYIPGSIKVYNGSHPDSVPITDDIEDILNSGIRIGSYAPRANSIVRFRARVINRDLIEGSNILTNQAYGIVGDKTVIDCANVIIFH